MHEYIIIIYSLYIVAMWIADIHIPKTYLPTYLPIPNTLNNNMHPKQV